MDLVVVGGESISFLMGTANAPVPLKRQVPGRGPRRVDAAVPFQFALEGAPARSRFALEGFRPNPALGAPVVEFTLADDSPAVIEVFDLAGRRMMRRDVGSFGAGRHVMRLESRATLVPGTYVVRLRQAGQTLSTRGSVTR